MVKGLCWLAVVTCFTLQWEFLHGRKRATCQSVCDGVGVPDGCKYAQDTSAGPEEVVVITNGSSNIRAWKWDTISMVVSTHFSSLKQTGLTACYTHSQGKRYGLREYMPSNLDELVASTDDVKVKFTEMILNYQRLMMADLMVFDFLDFFHKLDAGQSGVNVTATLSKMADVLSYATGKVQAQHPGEVYCIVPWKPPCEEEQCGALRGLLSSCHVLLMSPDSYQPEVAAGHQCLAQATVPISQFLYGIDRYLSLLAKPYPSTHIVAGIPWHGYAYKCDQAISHDNRCLISKNAGQACFNSSNRQRLSLSDIHSLSIAQSQVNMDVVTKGLYYRLNNTSQLWFENYTTLLIKYQLVKDLNLRGLSLWYGEDLAVGLSTDKTKFSMDSWSFLMHHVLHKAVYTPHTISHYYADTVAGIGVGCLLLGTLLGVIFTCIGFQRSKFRKLNRPFKLDEDENAFRDDEGL